MAHYDCRNCGEHMGIDFGYCTTCTPKRYFELEAKINECYAKHESRAKEYANAILKGLLSTDEEYQQLILEKRQIKKDNKQ